MLPYDKRFQAERQIQGRVSLRVMRICEDEHLATLDEGHTLPEPFKILCIHQ